MGIVNQAVEDRVGICRVAKHLGIPLILKASSAM